jgi:hypothetical protein
MKKLIEKSQSYALILGAAILITAIYNLIKKNTELAITGFIVAACLAACYFIMTFILKAMEKKEVKPGKISPLPANPTPVLVSDPLTVLEIIVLLEHPLRSEIDKQNLIGSIYNQQINEFKRVIAPSAKIQFFVAGKDIDDDAYIYAKCRSLFESISTFSNNDDFLQRVATGSFVASDGNHGKHFSLLNHKI